MKHDVTTQNIGPHQPRTRKADALNAVFSPRTRPALALPPLPQNAAQRADTLAALAANLVRWCGPATALALASWLDEVAAEAAGHADSA